MCEELFVFCRFSNFVKIDVDGSCFFISEEFIYRFLKVVSILRVEVVYEKY